MKATSALNLIESLEEHMFLLYDNFSRVFSRYPAASDLFDQLKREELTHVSMARRQKEKIMGDAGLAAIDISLDMGVMTLAIDSIKQSISTPPGSLKEALEKAYVLESSMAEHYVSTAMRGTDLGMDKLLLGHADELHTHYSRLMDFIKSQKLSPVSPEQEMLVQIRVPYKTTVTINGSLRAEAVDISEGGLFLRTTQAADAQAFKAGEEVALMLPMPGLRLQARAMVQSVQEGGGIGFRFLQMQQEHSEVIRDYIDRVVAGQRVVIPGEPSPEAAEAVAPVASASPASVTPASVTPASVTPASVTSGVKERVLIINNNVFSNSDMQMFVSALIDAGYYVMEIRNLTDSLKALDDHVQDRAVILSSEMVSDDGFAMLGHIKRKSAYGGVPIMVISTSYDRSFIDKVGRAGAAFARKTSLTPEALVSFIESN